MGARPLRPSPPLTAMARSSLSVTPATRRGILLDMDISRRALASGLAALVASALAHRAMADESGDLEVRDLVLGGDRAFARRFTLCVPKHLAQGEKVPLLVLLHGLGETHDPRAGAYASGRALWIASSRLPSAAP